MKKFVFAFAAIIVLSTVVNASVLNSANTLGAGKRGWIAAGSYHSNMGATGLGGNVTLIGAGGYYGYGLTDKLDIYGQLAYGTYGNLPLAGLSASEIMLGIQAKYQIVSENDMDMPISLAAMIGYQPSTATFSYGGSSAQAVQGDIGLGVVISKTMSPCVPYGAIAYHSLTANPGTITGSNLEITIGSQLLLSEKSSLIGELSLNSISSGGANISDTQISIGYMTKN